MNVSSLKINEQQSYLTLADIKDNQEIKIVDFLDVSETVKKHLHAYGLTYDRTVRVISTRPEVIIQIEETEIAM